MDASGGSGNFLLEVLHWLWLPVLLGAAVALVTAPGWRRSASRATRGAAIFAVAAVLGELVWRLASPASVPPLAAWSAAVFVLSLAFSALETRPRASAESAPGSQDSSLETPLEDDPFRPQWQVGERAATARPGAPSTVAPTDWPRLAFEQASEAIAALDLEGRVERVNRAWARLYGYRTDEVLGHHLSLFHPPGAMETLRPWLEEVRGTGTAGRESEHRKKDGSTFAAALDLALVHDDDASPVGFVAVARPAQEVLSAAVASGEAEELESLRVLVGSVTHELNNLLTGILGNASLVQQKLAAGSNDDVREIDQAARRAAELSRLLQAYTGKWQPAADSVPMNDVVAEAAAGLERIAGKRASLAYELTEGPSAISVDASQLRLLVRNLVANAADACGDGGEITVRTGRVELGRQELDALVLGNRRPEGPYVFVEVADNGHGIDAETRARLFEPFFTTRPERRGLGLAAVLGIARAHRGAIEVASPPGGGSRFRIVFPSSPQPTAPTTVPPGSAEDLETKAGPARDQAATEPETSTSENGTILVVDNERIIRDLATNVLEIHGFSVLTADEGRPAVGLYRRHHRSIRAVLLDLSMPIMDGEEVFAEIRKIDPKVQVILMTGHDAGDVRRSFEDMGLAGVLQKPFKPDQLIGTLRAVLGR